MAQAMGDAFEQGSQAPGAKENILAAIPHRNVFAAAKSKCYCTVAFGRDFFRPFWGSQEILSDSFTHRLRGGLRSFARFAGWQALTSCNNLTHRTIGRQGPPVHHRRVTER